MRAVVDVSVDFITQNVLLGGAYNCHQTDEWKNPPEATQDCLMDRAHLCANNGSKVHWDFTSCLFMNQFVTSNNNDHMRGFNQTVEYCSNLWGLGYKAVTECMYSDIGAHLLQASHKREQEHNSRTPGVNWIVVNGVNYADDENSDWLKIVCDAFTQSNTGSQTPASCPARNMLL